MKNKINNTQDLIYIGYIFLIVLGIIHESLFYTQIGINILEYSDILDVLISPISKLNSNILLLSISFFVVFIVIFFPRISKKFESKKWFSKFFKLENADTENDISKKVQQKLTLFASIFFIGIFVGSGMKRGQLLKTKIESRELEYKDQINFNDGKTLEAYIIGKNSSYIFYLTKENKNVRISPISGTIKYITINK